MGFELVIHTLIFTHTTTFVLNICIVKHIAYKTRVESRDASRRTTTSSWNMSWNGMEMMCTGFSRRKTTSGGMWVGQRAYTEQLVDCERVRRRGEYASDCRCNDDKKSNQRRGDRKTGRRRKRGSLQSSEWCGGIGFLLDYVRWVPSSSALSSSYGHIAPCDDALGMLYAAHQDDVFGVARVDETKENLWINLSAQYKKHDAKKTTFPALPPQRVTYIFHLFLWFRGVKEPICIA